MEELNERLAKSFGVKARKFIRQREGTIISEDTGLKLLKKTDKPLNKIMFSHEAKEYLINKGYNNIDRYACSLKGMPYVQVDNAIYIMTEQPKGETSECSFSSLADAVASAKELAHMHRNLNGLNIHNMDMEIKTLTLPNYYACRQKELKHIKKWILNQSHMSEFDLMFLKNYMYISEKVQETISILNSPIFKDICEKTKNDLLVCHNGIKEENIKLVDDTIFVSDFEECGYSHNIFDLSELIRRFIKNGSTDYSFVYEILNQYNNINQLSKSEISFIYYKLKTPDKVLKLINQYYNHRRTWSANSKVDNFERHILQYRRQVSMIDACADRIL